MGKRGRKPKERKGYFYETEEDAIVRYITETNETEKNRIFNNILYPALTKMIESIIRRYKLFIPDEDFVQNFNDTISYLLTKINHFDPSKGYKAYSYCGTVAKNYLLYKSGQYKKKLLKNTPYDDVIDEINNDVRYSVDEESNSNAAEELIQSISDEISKMIENYEIYELSESEVRVGQALIDLLTKWEEVLPNNGSNKLQKSSILYYLREQTLMSTKEVRDNMKKYKSLYYILKKSEAEE